MFSISVGKQADFARPYPQGGKSIPVRKRPHVPGSAGRGRLLMPDPFVELQNCRARPLHAPSGAVVERSLLRYSRSACVVL